MGRVCPACGVVLHRFSTPHGRSQIQDVWRCLRCDHREVGDVRDGIIEIESEYTLVITWLADELLPESIKLLRTIDPILGRLPAIDAIKTLRARQRWEIPGLSYLGVRWVALVGRPRPTRVATRREVYAFSDFPTSCDFVTPVGSEQPTGGTRLLHIHRGASCPQILPRKICSVNSRVKNNINSKIRKDLTSFGCKVFSMHSVERNTSSVKA